MSCIAVCSKFWKLAQDDRSAAPSLYTAHCGAGAGGARRGSAGLHRGQLRHLAQPVRARAPARALRCRARGGVLHWSGCHRIVQRCGVLPRACPACPPPSAPPPSGLPAPRQPPDTILATDATPACLSTVRRPSGLEVQLDGKGSMHCFDEDTFLSTFAPVKPSCLMSTPSSDSSQCPSPCSSVLRSAGRQNMGALYARQGAQRARGTRA